MKNSLISQLKEIGFSDNEALIYLELLSLKDASAVQIARNAKIAKTTIYDTLEKMRGKGFVSRWLKNGISYYTAESPNKILKLLEDKTEILKQVLPELRLLSKSDLMMPQATIYTGKEGAKIVLEDILEKAISQKLNTIYAYIKPDFILHLPKVSKRWITEREKHSIRMKLIHPELLPTDSMIGYEKNPLRETRIIKKEHDLESSIYIYGAYTALFYLNDNKTYSLIIKSEKFSNTLKGFFEFMWENLEQ
jgi:sugar-specific transcriptional regulator TrmB